VAFLAGKRTEKPPKYKIDNCDVAVEVAIMTGTLRRIFYLVKNKI
jgi:hypothetical protein